MANIQKIILHTESLHIFVERAFLMLSWDVQNKPVEKR